MKKFLKTTSFILVLILSITMLNGCSSKPELTPAQVATLYVDVVTQKEGAIEALDEYYGKDSGFTDEFNIEKIKENAVSAFNIPSVSDAKAEELMNSMFDAMQKAEYSATDGEDGLVTLTIKGIDFNKVTDSATKKLTNNAGNYPTVEKATNAMIDFMIEGLADAPLVSEATTMEAYFEKQDGLWIPKDPYGFGNNLVNHLLGI